MGEVSGLRRICQGEYAVYQRDALYCFIKGRWKRDGLTLKECLENGGRFVFTPAEISDGEQTAFFIRNTEEYFKRRNRNLLFLWVENPQDAFYQWRLYALEQQKGMQSLVFDSYRLRIMPWERLQAKEDGFVFSYSSPGYSFGYMDRTIRGHTKELWLGAAGQRCGAFCGSLFLEAGQAYHVMEMLDAGIFYCRVMGQGEEGAFANGYLSRARNSVLFPKGDLTMEFLLAPQCLSDANRARLSLSGAAFRANFATAAGRAVDVEADGDAALVFQERPVFAYEDERGNLRVRKRLCLGLSGGFRVAGEGKSLLCGSSGTETVRLETGGSLYFQPGMPCVMPYGDASLGTTSWAQYGKNAVYCCQPRQNALYAPGGGAGLRFLDVPAASFEGRTPLVPLLPFRGLEMDREGELQALEESLYLKRRQILREAAGNGKKQFPARAVTAVTPQGIMAEVTPYGDYNWIGFASLSDGEEMPQMRFGHVDEEIKQKFFQKELLYVIESAREFKKREPSDGFCFAVDGIRFMLRPDAWREGRTVMVFQYSATKCMKDALAGNPVFREALENAYTKTGEIRDGREALIEAVSDPAFQGMLAFNVSVSMEQMPPEAEFLLNGIDGSRFFASYLIVGAGKVSIGSSGRLSLSGSKVSALAEYQAPEKLVYSKTPPDYEYLVREIKIQVKESALVSFTSSSELLLNRIFEAGARADENQDGNCLVLEGRLVEKDGKRTCQFTLKQSVAYRIYGSAISDVRIDRADLVADGPLAGCFLLSGALSCRQEKEADLFGFGGKKAGEGLPFSQLALEMKQKKGVPAAFTMKYDTLHFDRENAALREGSFPQKFAVTLESFFAERAGETPEKKGYMPITAPISQDAPPEAYQGFVWSVQAGSLGALSGQDGITLRLLSAFWSGGEGQAEYYVGIKLPDILSGDKLKLQGIFKLGFGSVSLEKEDQEYRIRLHNFHLEILGASFPKGSSDIFLFSDGEHVGWHAAYEEGADGSGLQDGDTADGAGSDESD